MNLSKGAAEPDVEEVGKVPIINVVIIRGVCRDYESAIASCRSIMLTHFSNMSSGQSFQNISSPANDPRPIATSASKWVNFGKIHK